MENKVRELAEKFFEEAINQLDDPERKEEVELEKETYIGVWMLGYRAGESTQKQDKGWVKAKDRLPGYETPVKWRDGKDHSHVTDGKIPLIRMAKPFLTGWEWLDESGTPAAAREEDAVEFGMWLAKEQFESVNGKTMRSSNWNAGMPYSPSELYELFKQQKH